MLETSVGITSGVPDIGMTVPLGPMTVPLGILAGLTETPALPGLGLVLLPNVLGLRYEDEPPPLIMPTTLYILVITTINSFQCFALIQLLTSGGPNHSTDTIMYYIYYTAFKLYRYGYGNAMGVILAIMIAVLSAVQFKVTRSD